MPSFLISRYRKMLLAVLVLLGVLQPASLVVMGRWVQALIQNPEFGISLLSALTVLLSIGVLALSRFAERYIAELMTQNYLHEVRERSYQHALNMSAYHRDRLTVSATSVRLTNDMSALRNWYVQGMAPLIVLGVWLLISVLGLAYLHEILAVVALLGFLVAVAGNFFLGKRLYQQSVQTRRLRVFFIRNVAEKLGVLKLIQSFNQQTKEIRRFDRQSERLEKSLVQRAKTSGLMRGFNEIVLGLIFVGLLLTGNSLLQQSAITLDQLALLLAGTLYLFSHLRRLSRVYELWTLKQVAQDKYYRFLKRGKVQEEKRTKSLKQRAGWKLSQFYVDKRFPAVTTEFAMFERVLLRGDKGTGKSSFLQALAGLLPGYQGSVKVGGRRYDRTRLQSIHRGVALVSDELPLIKGSLKKNLFYGARQLSEHHTQQVLALCRIDGWMSNDSLHSIAPEGKNLSSSQRFCLMLARALLRRPQVLLLDSHEAYQQPEVQQVILSLCEEFPGLLVINAGFPKLERACHKVLEFSQSRVCVRSFSPQLLSEENYG